MPEMPNPGEDHGQSKSIRSVDLTKALAAANGQIKFIKMSGPQTINDVSTSFK